MNVPTARPAGFWERGGWMKAVLVAVVYLALYVGIGQLVGLVFGHLLDDGGVFASGTNVFLLLVLPIGCGAAIIAAFLLLTRMWRPVFARQPIAGRGWMWIAVVVVAYPVVLRLLGIGYGEYRPEVIALTFVAGVFIGIAEELVTRGAAVTLLRRAGHRELTVAVISSAIFAAMHLVNALGTGFTPTIGILLVYTFCFGVCMYLIMRVTGSIVWAIVAHALTDPTLFLATGGIDAVAGGPQNPLLVIAGTGNFAVIVFGIIALFLIRGRVGANDAMIEDFAR